jgi:hypothetical protein
VAFGSVALNLVPGFSEWVATNLPARPHRWHDNTSQCRHCRPGRHEPKLLSGHLR